MLITTYKGAIAASTPLAEAPPELPQLIAGLQGWISTTKGRFLFGDGSSTPGHGKTVQQARNVQDQTALFSQAAAGLRPAWDATTFDVPCIRSDGTQYLVRDAALPAPGLVIVGCALDSGSVGFHALAGARSTATPAGDAKEDAWTLNKTDSVNMMRALTATSSGQMFADTPQILGEKLLVMLEIVGNALQVWQVGATGEQTVAGTRIVADGEQALLAKYYNDAITAIMQGAIFEFAQYAPAPSRAERRMLVAYFQDLLWPGASPPAAAIVDGGQVERGQSALIDVVTPSSGAALVLASIDEQPQAGNLTISGGNVQITAPSDAPLGSFSGRYCLRSDVAGARLVDFGRVDFEIIEGAPAQTVDLPYFGQYYGGAPFGASSAANLRMRESDERANSFFFYADRTGTIDRILMHWRTYLSGYASGDGGRYTIEIKPANEETQLPILGSAPISKVDNILPGSSSANTWSNIVHTFTIQGQVVAKQPYCLAFRNTHANPNSNHVSLNVGLATSFNDPDGSQYQEPAGISPASVGGSIAAVNGWSPVMIDGTIRWHRWPAVAQSGALHYRRLGGLYAMLRYSDGQWVGPGGAYGGSTGYKIAISGNNHLRERFRVTRATRVVSGVFLRVVRINASTGNLVFSLESGPASDTAGNGTTVEQVTIPAASVFDLGASEALNNESGTATIDFVPWTWVPFTQNRTLTLGQIYNARLFASGGSFNMWCNGRADSFMQGPFGPSLSWSDWEAQRQIEWTAWEDSRGLMVSSNGGSSWGFGTPRLAMILFKCVL